MTDLRSPDAVIHELLAATSIEAVAQGVTAAVWDHCQPTYVSFATVEDDDFQVRHVQINRQWSETPLTGSFPPAFISPVVHDLIQQCSRVGQAGLFPDALPRESATVTAAPPGGFHRSVMIVPVSGWGILLLSAVEPGAFSSDDLQALERLCSMAQTTLDRIAAQSTDHAAIDTDDTFYRQLIRSFVHDLRNPLTVALGHLTVLTDGNHDDDEQSVETMTAALRRIDELLDRLAAIAESGDLVDSSTVVNIAEGAKQIWATIPATGATLDVTPVRIYADESAVSQLLENLLHNAITHGGGDVRIRVGPIDDGFFIEDSGPGIPDRDRERIFQAGYSTSDNGMGIGLSIVSAIVESHGWHIRVDQGSAGGARFVITGVKRPPE